MAIPVYSYRFALRAGFIGTFNGGTLPAGYVYVFRDLDVYYNGLEDCTVHLIGSSAQTIWFNHFEGLSGGQYASWRGRQILHAGENWKLTASNAVDFTLSGYRLTIPS